MITSAEIEDFVKMYDSSKFYCYKVNSDRISGG